MLEKVERYPLIFGPTPVEKLEQPGAHSGGRVEIYARYEDMGLDVRLIDDGFDIGIRKSCGNAIADVSQGQVLHNACGIGSAGPRIVRRSLMTANPLQVRRSVC